MSEQVKSVKSVSIAQKVLHWTQRALIVGSTIILVGCTTSIKLNVGQSMNVKVDGKIYAIQLTELMIPSETQGT